MSNNLSAEPTLGLNELSPFIDEIWKHRKAVTGCFQNYMVDILGRFEVMVRSRAAQARADAGWRAISEAPRDGTQIDVWTGNDEFPSRWTDVSWREPTDSEYWVSGSDEPDMIDTFGPEAGWFCNDGYTHKLQGESEPTHFMLKPQPPAAREGQP